MFVWKIEAQNTLELLAAIRGSLHPSVVVAGVLEANFVEPAHDKQGFESTPLLQRLEKWLARSQKSYW
jgi:hypothetical protein